MADITLLAAFLAGIISFLSPCILPLVPAFVSYLAGTSVRQVERMKNAKRLRLKIFLNSVAFVAGFAIVFSLLGVLLTSYLSNIAYDLKLNLSRIGGIIIVFFGLYLLGVVKIPFLQTEHKLTPKKLKYTYATSFVFGVAFATGWTPCVGAILGGILTLAITNPASAFSLLLAYTIGLGIPFLATGAFVMNVSVFIARIGKYLKYFNMLMGIILIILGVLVFTQWLPRIANFPWIETFLPQ